MGDQKVCTADNWEAGKEMLHKAKYPCGVIVVCGVPYYRNKFIFNALEKTVNMVERLYGSYEADNLQKLMQKYDAVCMSLTTKHAGKRAIRHKAVRALRDAGAKEVYMVYIKAPWTEFPEEKATYEALREKPPTISGLDGLIRLASDGF